MDLKRQMETIQQHLLPIKYTNEDCFMQENDKYGQASQISDFKSLCGFEVRTSVIIGLRIVVGHHCSHSSAYLLEDYFMLVTVLNTSSILTH